MPWCILLCLGYFSSRHKFKMTIVKDFKLVTAEQKPKCEALLSRALCAYNGCMPIKLAFGIGNQQCQSKGTEEACGKTRSWPEREGFEKKLNLECPGSSYIFIATLTDSGRLRGRHGVPEVRGKVAQRIPFVQ